MKLNEIKWLEDEEFYIMNKDILNINKQLKEHSKRIDYLEEKLINKDKPNDELFTFQNGGHGVCKREPAVLHCKFYNIIENWELEYSILKIVDNEFSLLNDYRLVKGKCCIGYYIYLGFKMVKYLGDCKNLTDAQQLLIDFILKAHNVKLIIGEREYLKPIRSKFTYVRNKYWDLNYIKNVGAGDFSYDASKFYISIDEYGIFSIMKGRPDKAYEETFTTLQEAKDKLLELENERLAKLGYKLEVVE